MKLVNFIGWLCLTLIFYWIMSVMAHYIGWKATSLIWAMSIVMAGLIMLAAYLTSL